MALKSNNFSVRMQHCGLLEENWPTSKPYETSQCTGQLPRDINQKLFPSVLSSYTASQAI